MDFKISQPADTREWPAHIAQEIRSYRDGLAELHEQYSTQMEVHKGVAQSHAESVGSLRDVITSMDAAQKSAWTTVERFSKSEKEAWARVERLRVDLADHKEIWVKEEKRLVSQFEACSANFSNLISEVCEINWQLTDARSELSRLNANQLVRFMKFLRLL